MENISLPQTITAKKIEDNHEEITISPCYPGYGTTLANALRRVLLSSLKGAAATAVKIKGADHEFSTIDNVKEDVVDIILNLKKIRFKIHSEEPVELKLKVKGDKKITAKDFTKNAQVEIANPTQVIATTTDSKAEFELTLLAQNGRGYIPVEMREKEKLDLGYIAIDAVYTPIKNVNFKTEHVRVEEMTNYDKLILTIVTDGSITPTEGLEQAANILVEQFGHIMSNVSNEDTEKKEAKPKKTKKEDKKEEEEEEKK